MKDNTAILQKYHAEILGLLVHMHEELHDYPEIVESMAKLCDDLDHRMLPDIDSVHDMWRFVERFVEGYSNWIAGTGVIFDHISQMPAARSTKMALGVTFTKYVELYKRCIRTFIDDIIKQIPMADDMYLMISIVLSVVKLSAADDREEQSEQDVFACRDICSE